MKSGSAKDVPPLAVADPLRHGPGSAVRGRGATFNPGNRYRHDAREACDDDWGPPPPDPERHDAPATPRQVRTTVAIQHARTIISRNDSPDIPFTQSINPYQGCEHEIRTTRRRPSP